MKKLVSILTLVSSFAFADSDVLARYEFAAGEGRDIQIYNSSLTNQGELLVAIFQKGGTPPRAVQKYQLSRQVALTLIAKAKLLATAELNEVNNAIICMMMPPPSMSVNELYVSQGSDSLRLVDGPHGCWVSHKVQPKSDFHHLTAHELKAELRVLALELSK